MITVIVTFPSKMMLHYPIYSRRGIALACLGGPIYAIGGLDDSTCFNTVERYDIGSDSWSCVQSMTFPRGGVAVATLKVRTICTLVYLYITMEVVNNFEAL